MKKQLLITSVLASGLMMAQVTKKVGIIPKNIANKAFPYSKVLTGNEIYSGSATSTVKPKQNNFSNLRTATTTSAIIGTTYYDLQSNSSVGDRIVVNADGSIATCWTMAPTNSGPSYGDRGTGYNYFNGSIWGAAPTARIESNRVGWGNVVNTRSNKELIVSHGISGGLLNVASRATKGTGAFAESTTAIPTATTSGNWWPRMVSSGDTIYSISVTQRTDASPAGALYFGLNGAVCFSRSKDAGATWDIVNTIPAGLDASRFIGHGGDAYAIAAKGSTVAIVAGDSGKDLVLSKSTDAGATWTYSVVLKFPLPLWDPSTTITDINGDLVADTVETNDGNLSVGLDINNKAYVFYGRMRIINDAPTSTGAYSYFPGTDGLMMWKESFAANTDTGGILVAQIQDLYQSGTIFFPTAPSGELSFGRWGCSLTSYPSVAIDGSNTIYLSYSSVVDSLMAVTSTSTTKLVRHLYIIKSTDGGINWTTPCDLVGLPGGIPYEGVFGSMAKNVNGNVHLIYQRDLAPGNGIPGTSGSPNPDEVDNTGQSNDIIYLKIPVGDIGTCVVPNSVKENSNTIAEVNFYPNPATINGTIDITLAENAKLDLTVMNCVGQTVYKTVVNGVAGSNKVNVDLNNLSNGIYFYQLKSANNKTITRKFVVGK